MDVGRLQGTKVQFWHIWDGAAGEAVQKLVDSFNRENQWGIQVEATYQGNLDDMEEKVKSAQATGDFPDLAVGYLYQALTWDSAKKVVNLGPYVADPLWGLSPAEQADIYPAFWKENITEGERYGIPALRSGQLIYYNVTWANELGFKQPPVTPEQFEKQACAAARTMRQDKDLTNDATGGWIISTDTSAVLGWMHSFGAQVSQTGSSGYRFNTPQVEEAFTFLRNLYDQGCAWLGQDESPASEFAGRMGLFASGSVMDIPFQATAFQRAGNQDQWTVIPFPSPSQKPAIDVYGPSYVVFNSTPERQLGAWLFIKWLVSPQNQAQLVQATSSFPLSAAALDYLREYKDNHPQWGAALDALSNASPEPSYRSWNLVRWAVYDAATQLFRYYFKIEQVPTLVRLLDQTAEELHSGVPAERVTGIPELTGTVTPLPISTVTKTAAPPGQP